MRTMFKETKQKCARDQRGVRKAAMLETDKMPTKQKNKTKKQTRVKRALNVFAGRCVPNLSENGFPSAITAAHL